MYQEVLVAAVVVSVALSATIIAAMGGRCIQSSTGEAWQQVRRRRCSSTRSSSSSGIR